MTDIDSMPAGPELDRLVAEKVMGWKQTGDHGSLKAYGERVIAESQVSAGGTRIDFAPSRNITHAWEVVQHLQWGFKGKRQLYLQTDGYGSEQWRASWHRPEEYVTQAEVEADTAPLAICRAALKALR